MKYPTFDLPLCFVLCSSYLGNGKTVLQHLCTYYHQRTVEVARVADTSDVRCKVEGTGAKMLSERTVTKYRIKIKDRSSASQ